MLQVMSRECMSFVTLHLSLQLTTVLPSPFSVCSTLTAVSQNYISRNISCNQEYFGVISDDRVVQMALSPIFVSRGFRELDMLDPESRSIVIEIGVCSCSDARAACRALGAGRFLVYCIERIGHHFVRYTSREFPSLARFAPSNYLRISI